MRLLITNDDGIEGAGLIELARSLSVDHEVWVVAPDKNRSAISNAITMNDPLKICKKKERWYTCSGAPVDCVVSGLRCILPAPPDAVLSGINKGANLGTDVVYSGTCAGARQATISGFPGIALSIEKYQEKGRWNFKPLADFVAKNLPSLITLCGPDVFVNINAPSADSYLGWRMTRLSRRTYHNTINTFRAPDGSTYTFFKGGYVSTEGDSDCDFAAVSQGLISISRIHAQPRDADDMKEKGLKLSL
ncbi:MAG: 5'/3'-nucleotidase SurE [Spirochaetaceae bacterium]|nr:5'/3'-nucleotidase SurE [Spirochaetaceae bacterium]MBR2462807.1 5'/3'-nucleotidase SurE [Spirochaetaceae bacterium]